MKPVLSFMVAALAGLAFLLAGCTSDDHGISEPTTSPSSLQPLQKAGGAVGSEMLAAINVALASQRKAVRVMKVEYITAPTSGQIGTTIFARNVGNKQLSDHWVPYDPRRGGERFITYAVDHTDIVINGGVTPSEAEAAIDNAMDTWDDQSCSTIPIAKADVANDPDLGYVQFLLGLGGMPGWGADYTHAGWLPAAFFDAIATNGSQYILGATFTFIWVDGGDPTDIDKNGKADVAFRETYYNDVFTWSIDGPAWYDTDVDVETIVLHESGHGLSQAHFGMMFVDASDKEPPYPISHLHFAPRAVMNSVYFGTLRELLGSDVAGHCSIWARWPVR